MGYSSIKLVGFTLISLILTHFYVNTILGIGASETEKVENLEKNNLSGVIQYTHHEKPIDTLKQERFKKVKRVFGHYNKNVSDKTISTFLDVCYHYDLIKDETYLDLYIGQICIESGAKQYFQDGTIVKSSGNAIGVGQIVPTTAFYYLKHYIPDKEKKVWDSKGIDTDFIKNYELRTVKVAKDSTVTYAAGEGRQKVIEWLKNEKNNLYLWGYIMKNNLGRFNVHESLVAYNEGPHALKKIRNPHTHIYVKKIKSVVYNKVKKGKDLALN